MRAAALGQLRAGKEIANLERGGFRRVRAVRAIVLDAFAELSANGARGGLGWIGCAHRFAPFGDGVFRFEHHSHSFAATHKFRQLAEKRTRAVNRVKSLGLRLGQAQRFYRDDLKFRRMDAADNVAGEAAAHSIRLNNCQSSFDSHSIHLPSLRIIGATWPGALQSYFFFLPRPFDFPAAFFLAEGLDFDADLPSAAAIVWPISAGLCTVRIPAARIALYFSAAVPWPPLIIAPACPMRRPGGAVCPAMKPTTGFFTFFLMYSAATSSALPPISPIITIAWVSRSSLNSLIASRKLVPIIGSPPIPMQVDCPMPRCVS